MASRTNKGPDMRTGVTRQRIDPLNKGKATCASSRSPADNGEQKPKDTRHFLNKKRLKEGYDVKDILNKKAASREHNSRIPNHEEGHGNSAQSNPTIMNSGALQSMVPLSHSIIEAPSPGQIKTPPTESLTGLTDANDHMTT